MPGKIEFGVTLRKSVTVIEESRQAEADGFDFFACGEHLFFNTAVDNALVALAGAAGATSAIKLMSTVALAPLYPAAMLAKQVVTLDQVCGGRFHFGVGVGGENETEFDACQIPVSERGRRTNEMLEVFLRLCHEDNVYFDGRFTTLKGVTLDPKPLAKPHPPIWISGRSKAAMQRCARFGDGWLPYMYSPERLADSVLAINTYRKDMDRHSEVHTGVYLPFSVHRDHATGRRMAIEILSAEYNQDFTDLVDKYVIAGDPAHCIRRLNEYVDAGASTIILGAASFEDQHRASQSLMATEVLPALIP